MDLMIFIYCINLEATTAIKASQIFLTATVNKHEDNLNTGVKYVDMGFNLYKNMENLFEK